MLSDKVDEIRYQLECLLAKVLQATVLKNYIENMYYYEMKHAEQDEPQRIR